MKEKTDESDYDDFELVGKLTSMNDPGGKYKTPEDRKKAESDREAQGDAGWAEFCRNLEDQVRATILFDPKANKTRQESESPLSEIDEQDDSQRKKAA